MFLFRLFRNKAFITVELEIKKQLRHTESAVLPDGSRQQWVEGVEPVVHFFIAAGLQEDPTMLSDHRKRVRGLQEKIIIQRVTHQVFLQLLSNSVMIKLP